MSLRTIRLGEQTATKTLHEIPSPHSSMICVYLTTKKDFQELNATYSQLFTRPVLQ